MTTQYEQQLERVLAFENLNVMEAAQGAGGRETAGAEAGGQLLPGLARRDRAGPRGLQAPHAHRAQKVCVCVFVCVFVCVCVSYEYALHRETLYLSC